MSHMHAVSAYRFTVVYKLLNRIYSLGPQDIDYTQTEGPRRVYPSVLSLFSHSTCLHDSKSSLLCRFPENGKQWVALRER